MTLKDKMQTAVDALLNESNGSTETSKIVAVCAEVAENYATDFFKWADSNGFFWCLKDECWKSYASKVTRDSSDMHHLYSMENKKG